MAGFEVITEVNEAVKMMRKAVPKSATKGIHHQWRSV
jgi:hypothetical protein